MNNMTCPKCGSALRKSTKDPNYSLCDNCRIRFKVDADHSAPAPTARPARPQPDPAPRQTPPEAPQQRKPVRPDPALQQRPVRPDPSTRPQRVRQDEPVPRKRVQQDEVPRRRRPDHVTRSLHSQRLSEEPIQRTAPLRTWKLVSGILSILLFFIVSFQSCAAGLANTLAETGELSGSAGIVVAVMLLVGGIVSIATRNSGKGGNIALIILYGIGALFGYALAGSYRDLIIWATWCLICIIFAIIALIKGRGRG